MLPQKSSAATTDTFPPDDEDEDEDEDEPHAASANAATRTAPSRRDPMRPFMPATLVETRSQSQPEWERVSEIRG